MKADITYLVGDATQPVGHGPRIIAHIVNDVGGWGAGFVLAMSRRWPEPEAAFREAFAAGGGKTLGRVTTVLVECGLWVANLYAQHGVGRRHGPPIRYGMLKTCLRGLAAECEQLGASVHMPRIGCGLAGGSWGEVEPIVRETLCEAGVPVTVYDLPARG